MASLMLNNITVKANILEDEKYKYIFSVEAVNELVLQGIPFRDAYKKVGEDIEANTFQWKKPLNHTHEGSIGNLQNPEIEQMMQEVLRRFNFSRVNDALNALLNSD